MTSPLRGAPTACPPPSPLPETDLLDRAWALHPSVAVRPEPFGALLYHFGTRRLSFLKDPRLLLVVQHLPQVPSARAACLAAGVGSAELPSYARSLGTLIDTDMILERPL